MNYISFLIESLFIGPKPFGALINKLDKLTDLYARTIVDEGYVIKELIRDLESAIDDWIDQQGELKITKRNIVLNTIDQIIRFFDTGKPRIYESDIDQELKYDIIRNIGFCLERLYDAKSIISDTTSVDKSFKKFTI